MKDLLDKLYEEVKHGDDEHQKWLRDKINEFLSQPHIQKDIVSYKREIMEDIKSTFDLHSDHSTTCNGYRSLCRQIDELK